MGRGRLLRGLGWTFVSGCGMVTFFDRIGHPAVIAGNSMFPTLEGNSPSLLQRDFVWLSAMAPYYTPKSGDVITFVSPRQPEEVHIKRCTAVEGNVVKPSRRDELMIIPKGTFWMESDNSYNANDSNVYGPVNRGLMQGKATHIIWPPSRWRKL